LNNNRKDLRGSYGANSALKRSYYKHVVPTGPTYNIGVLIMNRSPD
jgi:hypothetical protein